MRFEKSKSDNYTTIKLLDSKLDTRNAADLKGEFVVTHTEGVRYLILNLSEVSYADSSGLSSILVGNRLFKSTGGMLVLCALPPFIEKLIKISQLDSVFTILPTEDEAREAVFMHTLENQIEEEDAAKTTDQEVPASDN